jgi:hypothetical protein
MLRQQDNLFLLSGRTYTVNEDYFEKIDTPNKAYFLGMFYADGCNYNNSVEKDYLVVLALKKTDIELLEKFSVEINSNKPISFRKNLAVVGINSKKMSNDLINVGCMPAKTHKLEFPEWLREDLVRHFIRGYFDGDGCITYKADKKSDTISPVINFTGRKTLLTRIQQQLSKDLSFMPAKIFDRMPANDIDSYKSGFDICQFSNGGRNNIINYCNYIYNDADMFLKRKKDKMEMLIKYTKYTEAKPFLDSYRYQTNKSDECLVVLQKKLKDKRKLLNLNGYL